jgi:asparagine synthase (glutamine-hydrolysing)
MTKSLQHETFYVAGTHAAPELGVYAGWIAHDDSFACQLARAQTSLDDVKLLLSGECYADPDRIKALEPGRHHWLLALYEKLGDAFVQELNGLFSGLLIDISGKKVLLFNDRFGVNRVYWHQAEDAFYFATEAKALLRVLPQLRSFDHRGLAQFLAIGSTVDNTTLFRGVNLLPAASSWLFQQETVKKRIYFSVKSWESQPQLSREHFQHELEDTFNRIVPRYCQSPSQMGISLTAGLDSRMLMACLPEEIGSPVCYTYDGTKGTTLDTKLAAQIASACGLQHHVLRIKEDFFSGFPSIADRTVYLTDGCHGITGTHEIYLNRQGRDLAPIRLTGVFGSEVLRSVSTFKSLSLCPELLAPEWRQSVALQLQEFAGASSHPVTFAAFKEIPWSLFGSLSAACSQVSYRTPYLDNEIVALAFRAPDSARSSDSAVDLVRKGHGPLSRIPTDMGLLGSYGRLSRTLTNFGSKAAFKLDYIWNDGMPHWLGVLDPVFDRLNSNIGILGAHKYLHYRRWFRRELADYVADAMEDIQNRPGPWNSKFLDTLVRRHKSGERNYLREMNAVLTVGAIQRLLLR